MALDTPPCQEKDNHYIHAPGGSMRDTEDDKVFRHGRDRHKGFAVGKYIMPVPVLFTRDKHPLWLGDMYRGRSLFLICGGPSVRELDLELLRGPGTVTMSLNNGPATFRTDLWCEVDNPQNFLQSIWMDAKIMKFAPLCHTTKKLFDGILWKESKVKVGDCPNVVYYTRNETFCAEQWLWEDSLNWGNHGDYCVKCNYNRGSKKKGKKRVNVCPACGSDLFGCRSVMLPAVRIAFILGFRRVFLLGADFKMSDGKQNYHFAQARSKQSVKNNNTTYKALDWRFNQLRPYFEKQDFYVYNCNPDSGLTAFEHVPYSQAVAAARSEMPDPTKEGTEGRYDREATDKAGKAQAKKENASESKLEASTDKLTMAELLKMKAAENAQ